MKKHYISCHECDEISIISAPHKVGRYKCSNCGHLLYANKPEMIEKVFAYNLAALILFAVTNYFPFLSFHVIGNTAHANFTTSIYYLFQEEQWMMGGIILMTTIVVPLTRILLYLILFGPLYFGYLPRYSVQILKWLESLLPWGMLDVFLVGVLVSMVKLIKMGTIIPGTSLWAFMIMVFVLAAAQVTFEPHQIWDRIGKAQQRRKQEVLA
jgi:paraquat-inducible protein A